MACNEDTKEIDGSTYYVRQLPASQGVKLQLRVMKILGPALSALAKNDVPDNDKALMAIQAVLTNLSEAEAFAFIQDVVKMAAKDGSMITNLDVAFADSPAAVYKVAAFVLEVNLKSFFPALEKFDVGSVLKKK